jgi:hypothetical protein
VWGNVVLFVELICVIICVMVMVVIVRIAVVIISTVSAVNHRLIISLTIIVITPPLLLTHTTITVQNLRLGEQILVFSTLFPSSGR